jgi:predicted RND superfamily exporter protein
MVSSMLTAVVTVVGVATLVHVMVRHRELVLSGVAAEAALEQTLEELVAPIWWACATDAVAFFCLMTARVGPVRDFGLMMAIGSLMVFLSVLIWVPGLALWRPAWDRLRKVRGARRGAALLRGLAEAIWDRGVTVTIGTALVTGLAGWGWQYLQVESDFTRNFRSDSQLVQAYERVETNLGGAGVADVILPIDRLDAEFLTRVWQMEEAIRRELIVDGSSGEPGLTKVMSLVDGLRGFSPVPFDQIPLAALRDQAVAVGSASMQTTLPAFYGSMIGEDPATGRQYYRVMVRARERQTAAEKKALLRQLQEIVDQHFPRAQLTGAFVLVASLIESVLADQWKTFALALAAIGVMMAFAFRSWRWGVLLLIPNVVPIVIVLGCLGWLCRIEGWGWRVNIGVAMIAAVSAGLAIDGSLHYLFGVRRFMRQGDTLRAALQHAHAQVGLSMSISTLSLLVGFSVLCQSRFLPTVSFGALTALTMLGGTIGNLLLMPVLARWVEPSIPIPRKTDGPSAAGTTRPV